MISRLFGLLAILALFISVVNAQAQSYEDKRCRCICPSIASVQNNAQDTERLYYIENVPPTMCNCDGVILPRVRDKLMGKEREFCPRCECNYEYRNTAIIKVVVIMVIWIISILVIYMLFLMCLDPLLNKRAKANYQEHTNEDDDTTSVGVPGQSSPASVQAMSSRGNVLNRVGHQQDKWKRQVREQRRNIYDKHTMLN